MMYGMLPSEMQRFSSLVYFDLSANNFSGPAVMLNVVPDANCNLTFNCLSGSYCPSGCNCSFQACGKPFVSLAPVTMMTMKGSVPEISSSRTGVIIGGVVGGLVALAAIIGIIVFHMMRRAQEPKKSALRERTVTTSQLPTYGASAEPAYANLSGCIAVVDGYDVGNVAEHVSTTTVVNVSEYERGNIPLQTALCQTTRVVDVTNTSSAEEVVCDKATTHVC